MTKSITIEEFKAQCLTLLDGVATTGEPVVITRDGVPVAELSRAKADPLPVGEKPKSIIGALKGTILYMGDIVSPIDVEPNMADNNAEPSEPVSEPVVIAKDNEPATDLSPARGIPKSLYGLMKGRIRSTGDIVSPLDEQWDALK